MPDFRLPVWCHWISRWKRWVSTVTLPTLSLALCWQFEHGCENSSSVDRVRHPPKWKMCEHVSLLHVFLFLLCLPSECNLLPSNIFWKKSFVFLLLYLFSSSFEQQSDVRAKCIVFLWFFFEMQKIQWNVEVNQNLYHTPLFYNRYLCVFM